MRRIYTFYLECPSTVFKNLHSFARLGDADDGHIARADHEVYVDHTVVDTARFAFFVGELFKAL